jgi:hypothetical protein
MGLNEIAALMLNDLESDARFPVMKKPYEKDVLLL